MKIPLNKEEHIEIRDEGQNIVIHAEGGNAIFWTIFTLALIASCVIAVIAQTIR